MEIAIVQEAFTKITTECYQSDNPDEYVRAKATAFLEANVNVLPQPHLQLFFTAINAWYAQRVQISTMALTPAC